MLFDIEGLRHKVDEDALHKWLATRLQSACEADPNVLAKYICVLLKNEHSLAELKAMCTDQLEEFLKEGPQ